MRTAVLSRAGPAGEGEPALRSQTPGPGWERWLAPVVVVVAVAGAHVWLSGHMRAPVIQADEFGYLYGAHYLALGGPPPATPGFPASPYFPGYSLFLVPLWWLSRDTATVYHWALLVNSALASAGAWLAYLLAGRLAPSLSPRVRAVVALVVSAYPSFLMFGNLAESENLLVPAFLGVCLLARRAFAGHRAVTWAGLGLAGGLIYAVHPSALAVTFAVAVVGVWVARPWARATTPSDGRPGRAGSGRLGAAPALALGAGLVAGLALSHALVAYVTAGGPSSGGGLAAGLAREANPSALASLGVVASGQILYLLAATAGLVVLGVALLARAVVMVARHRSPPTPPLRRRRRRALLEVLGTDGPGCPARLQTLALVGVAALVTLVVSVVSIGHGTRVDTYLYGRYDEGVLAPVLVAGALVGVGVGRRIRRPRPGRTVLVGLGALAVTAAGLAAGAGAVLRGTVQATNVLAVHALFGSAPGGISLSVAALAGFGAAALAVTVAGWRRSLVLGAVLVVAAFAPSTSASLSDLAHQSRGTAAQQVVPDTLVAVRSRWGPVPGCVASELAPSQAFSFFNDRLYDPAQRFAPFRPGGAQAPCSPEVVAGRPGAKAGAGGRSNPTGVPGAREVVPGNYVDQALWVLPGPLQDRLARAGWLFPAGGPAPLPAAAQVADVGLAAGQPGTIELPAGGTATVRVGVAHRPGGPGDAPWPDAAGLGGDHLAVRVAAAWVRVGGAVSRSSGTPAGSAGAGSAGAGSGLGSGSPKASSPASPASAGTAGAVVARSFADLPRTVLPGQAVTADVVLAATTASGQPLPPGRYRVTFGLVQQGVGPFPSGPASTASVTVTLRSA